MDLQSVSVCLMQGRTLEKSSRMSGITDGSYDFIEAVPARLPVLLSSPHSGTAFPDEYREGLAVKEEVLRPLGDGPVDRMFEPVCDDAGVSMIRARYSRAVVDLNRKADEIAPELLATPGHHRLRVTDKVRVGLGVIPTRINSIVLHARSMSDEELRGRIDGLHEPYHEAIDATMSDLSERFGHALLVDCHSMPSGIAVVQGRAVDVVIGDAHGRSAEPALVDLAFETFGSAGFLVRLNQPYAGGYITRRHGRPRFGRSAIQFEFQRNLFMDESSRQLHEGSRRIALAMQEFVGRAGAWITGHRRAVVAA